ncbi:MAG TPA: hypothetical protein VFE58_09220 [Tepidisphaeraceae bacterium]|nr:hypothetical protein [Tepidisphaeraceae bacterium]
MNVMADDLKDGETKVAVTLSGGHDTEGKDRGRPVVLVAAGLGVPAEVFREAFTHVKPAGPGQQPDPDQVRQNKKALMDRLAKYGVTNDRLDEVSNYYRYRRESGKLWRNEPAKAYAVVKDGVITRFVIDAAGAGYSSAPTVTVEGMPDIKATAAVSYGKDLKTNGSVSAITTSSTQNPS